MENELKSILVKVKRDVLSDVVRIMREQKEEGFIIGFDEVMEIINDLSSSYDR